MSDGITYDFERPIYTLSKAPQFARFGRVFACSPIVKIHKTPCILPGVVIVAMRHINWVDETG